MRNFIGSHHWQCEILPIDMCMYFFLLALSFRSLSQSPIWTVWPSGVSGFRRWRLALDFNLSRMRDSPVRFLLIVRSERRHCTHVPHANSRGARPSSKMNIGESSQRDATSMGNRLFKAHTAATKLMHRIPASTRLSSPSVRFHFRLHS